MMKAYGITDIATNAAIQPCCVVVSRLRLPSDKEPRDVKTSAFDGGVGGSRECLRLEASAAPSGNAVPGRSPHYPLTTHHYPLSTRLWPPLLPVAAGQGR